ncbi:MAG: hypothetical protein KDE27_19105 [Planctomycetes bacterium]|nr:hypothetical protein [Planctomycetota bacterium]
MALTSSKQRKYCAGHPEDEVVLPIKAGQTIYEGAALEFNGGYLENLSGAGVFAGFALEDSTAVTGESDGDRTIRVRVRGVVELKITTDTVAQSNIGVAATVIEATDNDTFRIETGSAITGTLIGNPFRVVTAGAGGVLEVSFKAPMGA